MKCNKTKHTYNYFNPQITQIFILLLCGNLLFAGGNTEVLESGEVPTKIVSLSPAATEILFAVGAGDNIIARTDFCNYPAEVATIPSIGGFDGKAFSIESIIALEPDFVYTTAGMHDYLEKPLESYGIQVYKSNAQSIESIYTEIEAIANLTGNKENGITLVLSMKEHIQNVTNVIQSLPKKSVYWEVWNEPFMSAGASSYISDVIEKAGGVNIFADIPQAYPVVSEETILMRNPDVILFPTHTITSVEELHMRDGWINLTAVKNEDMYFIDSDIASRPGPRSALAVETIAKKLFPNEDF